MEEESVSRREFGQQLATQVATYSFAARSFAARKVAPPTFSDQLFRAVNKTGLLVGDFWRTDEVSQHAGLPVTGVQHHLWIGHSGLFRSESSRAAGAIAGHVGIILGTQAHWNSLVTLCLEFFGNRQVPNENPVVVLVCKGHVTTRHAFAQNRHIAQNLPPRDGDIRVVSTRDQQNLMLDFAGGWRGYRTAFHLLQGMRAPSGRSDVALVRRRRLRAYRSPAGKLLRVKDFIVQYSPADADPSGVDMRAIWAGGYFPNSEPFRRPLNDLGYTDSTSVVFARVVGGPHARYVHQVNVNFNIGLIRGQLAPHDGNDPEEVLDINTVVRPLDRMFDQYSSLREILEKKVFARS